MSFPVSSMVPRYLHDLHESSLFLFIVNSTFDSFTFKFLCFSFAGTVFLTLLILCFDVDAHPVTSAFF